MGVDSVRRGRVPYYHPIQTKTAYMQSMAQEVSFYYSFIEMSRDFSINL